MIYDNIFTAPNSYWKEFNRLLMCRFLVNAQCGRGFCLVATLAARKFHLEMLTVMVISNVILVDGRVVAVGAKMKNLVMDLLHVSSRIAGVPKLFLTQGTPVQSIFPFLYK